MRLISVVIPTRNHSKYLDECLHSLFSQNYPMDKFEVIVADDDSSDNTQEVLEKYKRKYRNLKVIKNSQQIGNPASRNACIDISEGQIIASTDSDCIVDPYWLQKIERIFQNFEVVCVQGTQRCGGKWGKYMREGDDFIRVWKKRKRLDAKNLIIKKDIIKRYKFQNNIEDFDLAYRLVKDNIRIYYDSSIVVTHLTDRFSEVMRKGKKWGNRLNLVYQMYGWDYIDPKHKYPFVIVFILCLGGFFINIPRKGIRGALASSMTFCLANFYFKRIKGCNKPIRSK